MRSWRAYIDFRVGQRPYGIITTWIDPDEGFTPAAPIPWVPGEHPGIFNAIEDGEFEEISEAFLLLGREI